MKRTFVETLIFTKRWKSLKLTDDDLCNLQNFLVKNPTAGDVIVGTGGLKKLRWMLPNTGKSGGIRVLHVDFVQKETVFLINCYSKRQKDNLSANEKAIYKSLIDAIEEELK